MDSGRGPAKLGLALWLGLAIGSASAADLSLDIQAGHSSLRFELPDSVYAAGATANFAGLQLTDQDGRAIDFAVCPIRQNSEQTQAARLIALPDLARPILSSDDQLSFTRPAGAGPIEAIDAWILDLREIEGQLIGLSGLPAIRSLRLSPNLQQWSAEKAFVQNADSLQLESTPVRFIRLKPAQPTAWGSIELKVQARFQLQGQRKPHWFSPTSLPENLLGNERALPVIAARLKQDLAAQDWQLQSRQGRWDAWKPRGYHRSGDSQNQIFFSAVSDPQWKVIGAEQSELQLAHAAHEIRIPQISAKSAIRLNLQAGKRHGPNLSCAATAGLALRQPLQISVSSEQAKDEDAAPYNVRSVFLMVVAVLISIGLLFRRRILNRLQN